MHCSATFSRDQIQNFANEYPFYHNPWTVSNDRYTSDLTTSDQRSCENQILRSTFPVHFCLEELCTNPLHASELLCWSKHQQRLWMGSDPLRTLRSHDALGSSNTDGPAAEFFLASSFSEEIPLSQRRRSFHLKTRSVFLMPHTFSGLQANNKPQQSSTRSLIVAKETRDNFLAGTKARFYPSFCAAFYQKCGFWSKRKKNKK